MLSSSQLDGAETCFNFIREFFQQVVEFDMK